MAEADASVGPRQRPLASATAHLGRRSVSLRLMRHRSPLDRLSRGSIVTRADLGPLRVAVLARSPHADRRWGLEVR